MKREKDEAEGNKNVGFVRYLSIYAIKKTRKRKKKRGVGGCGGRYHSLGFMEAFQHTNSNVNGRGEGGGGGATVTVFIFAKCRPPHPKISYFISSSFSRKCLSPPVYIFLINSLLFCNFFSSSAQIKSAYQRVVSHITKSRRALTFSPFRSLLRFYVACQISKSTANSDDVLGDFYVAHITWLKMQLLPTCL